MATISLQTAVTQVGAVLREAFEGASPSGGFFTDGPADTALFGTLAALSAAQASRAVAGKSIAAHVQHTTFGLRASAKWIRGDTSPNDWTESWAVDAVDDAAWARLQQQVRTDYDALCRAVTEAAAGRDEAFGAAVGAVAHVAYHLGAIRQKAALVRQG